MNQKLLSGLTATLLMTTLGTPLSSYAETSKAEDQVPETNLKTAYNQPSTPAVDLSSEVVKLGEQQSQTTPADRSAVIAKVHAHELSGRRAATLYVRNIPVLTVLGSNNAAPEEVKLGTQASNASEATALAKALDSSTVEQGEAVETLDALQNGIPSASVNASSNDPAWRAAEIAARINQLNRDGIDAKAITVKWSAKESAAGQYLIQVDGEVLAVMDASTILPDTTRNLEHDALQVTNRLRRLLGNAKPLSGVVGRPRRTQEVAIGPFRIPLSGMASWYGPGLHGNMSASGEMFNQHAMTAAHRTLPFGTQVRVTNMDNGVSVVVRINDRGPFHGNRIIDLSMAAARVIGLVNSGVAPVRLEVMTPQSVATETR